MKLGEALKGQFDAVRKRLEKTPTPQMGVVVPAPGVPTKREYVEDMAKLGAQAFITVNVPKKVDVTPLAVAIDEGQLVGELLEWLRKEGFIQPANRPDLAVRRFGSLIEIQCWFFEERDK